VSSDQPESKLQHIGFILDGNRRWAQAHGLPRLEGHRRGYDNLKKIADLVFDQGIPFVTAYVFSTENWQRSKEEVKFLMDFAYQVYVKDLGELHKKGIRLVWLGSREEVSDKLRRAIEDAEEKTRDNTHGTLCLCFNYGGRAEIVTAVQQIVREKIPADDITQEVIKSHLYSADIPDPDLIIRTSGEQRLSNFLLWGSAYSELMFEPMHWPDFDEQALVKALEEYHNRTRRFGK